MRHHSQIQHYPYVHSNGDVEYRRFENFKAATQLVQNRSKTVILIEFHDSASLENINLLDLFSSAILHHLSDPHSNYMLIVTNMFEKYHNTYDMIYHVLVDKYKICPCNILLVSSIFGHDRIINGYIKEKCLEPIGYEYFDAFEYMFKTGRLTNLVDTCNIDNINHTFLNFNKRWHSHRLILIAMMKCLNIFDEGMVSLGQSDSENAWDQFDEYTKWLEHTEFHDLFKLHKQDIINMPYMYLDAINLTEGNNLRSGKELYEQSLLSIIGETTYFDQNHDLIDAEPGVFCTEKTYKCMAHKHPFIVVSNSGFLRLLKHKGYLTFDKFINEDYDNESNDIKRMIMIAKELERICQWDTKKRKEFCDYAKPIVQHNFDLLLDIKSRI